jgi:hypothetical protein
MLMECKPDHDYPSDFNEQGMSYQVNDRVRMVALA